MLPLCEREGLGFTPFSPLAGGWLTGKYRRDGRYPSGSRMTMRPDPYRDLVTDETFDGARSLRAAAAELGVEPATLAVAWVLAHPQRDRRRRRPEAAGAARVGPCRDRARASRASSATSWTGCSHERAARPRHDDVKRLLPMDDCIELMAGVLADLARGSVWQPLRFVVRPPDEPSLMGLMPAHRSEPTARVRR